MRIPRILMLVGAVYLIALTASSVLSQGAMLGTAGATAIAVGLAWRLSPDREITALVAWAPIHLLLLGTGSLASPLLPLAAGWIILLVVVAPGLAVAAAAGIALLVPTVHRLTEGAWPDTAALVTHILILGVALSALLIGRGTPKRRDADRASGSDRVQPSPSPSSLDPASAGDRFADALELIRMAAGAKQAVLWKGDAEHRSAQLRAWAGEDEAPPAPRVALPGHPFEWSMLERVNIQLEAGRKPLPAAWAEEMLLVPVDLPEGLLTLAFRGRASPVAGEAARRGAPHLAALERLSAIDRQAERAKSRMDAVMEVVRALSTEPDLETLGTLLSRTALESTGASGVAVTASQTDRGRSQVVGGAGAGTELVDRISEEESRVEIAARGGAVLFYEDLRAEHPTRPLVHGGEKIEPKPRSVMIAPLTNGGEVHGTIVLWHVEPNRFRHEDADLISLLCSLAGPTLAVAQRQASREGEVAAANL